MNRKRTSQAELIVALDELTQHKSQEAEVLRKAYIAEGLDPDQPQVGKTVTLDNSKEGVRRYIRNGRVIAEFKGTTQDFLLKSLGRV